MTRIAIDAMGGDHAPHEIVKGALWAASEYDVAIELVGKEDEIQKVIDDVRRYGIRTANLNAPKGRIRVDVDKLDIKITPASEVIEMGEAPGAAIRKKKDSSIVLAVKSVATGSSQAVVAAGSTGAAMASSLFGLGRLPGIERPAIATTLPTMKKPVVMIDSGANSNCTAEMLYQFAIMGASFAKNVLGIDKPRIGVLNIGEEAGKGNELAQAAYKLLEDNKDGLNFIAIDFETATGKRASICEVGICVVRNGEIIETRSWLVRPEDNLYSYWNMKCHGITPEDTENSPSFPEVWEEIERLYLDEFDTLVAHNAPFDRSCLEHSARLYNLHLPELQWQCTLKIARQVYDFGCNTLGYLCEQLGIPEGTHHRAGDDAEMCARLYLREREDF